MQSVQIDRLGPDEGARLRAIRLRALQDAPDAFGSTYDETVARPTGDWHTQLEDLATYVVVIDGEDVGMVRGGPFDGRTGVALMLSMWVAPSARGTGVGDALVDTVIAWAIDAGFEQLVLDVADDSAPAVGLYARHGFEPTGNTGTLPPPREHVREHERALPLPRVQSFDRDRTAQIASFIHACTGGAMETDWASFVLTQIAAGPEAVRDLWRGDRRVGVGVCLDTCETEGNAAELSVFCAEPFEPAVLCALLMWGQRRAVRAGRSHVDIPAWPGIHLPSALLHARGYRVGHVMFNMRRPADAPPPPVPRTALPAGWRWEPATLAHARDYHATVGAAFRGTPSAFLSPFEAFEQRLAAADPQPLLLLTDDPHTPVAGFVRAERRSDGGGEIGSLGRHPRYRGLGLGPHLLTRGLAWLAQQGAGDVILEVAATNASGIALYESHGFVTERDMPVYRLAVS